MSKRKIRMFYRNPKLHDLFVGLGFGLGLIMLMGLARN